MEAILNNATSWGAEATKLNTNFTDLDDVVISSVNIFNYLKMVAGSAVVSDGTFVATGSYNRTPHLRIMPSSYYALSGWTTAASTKGAYYTINKVFISEVSLTGISGGNTIITPSNAAYVILNFGGADNGSTAQIEKGKTVTTYKAYAGKYLKASSLDVTPIADDNAYWKLKELSPEICKYPDVKSFIKGFLQAYGNYSTQQYKPVTIVTLGDSLFALTDQTSAGTITPSTNPPGLNTRNIPAAWWEQLRTKPNLYRWDAAGVFTETGTFGSLTGYIGSGVWDDNGDRDIATRYSGSVSPVVAFQIAAAFKGFNFMDRAATNGKSVNTVAITEGNGWMEVLNGSDQWVEANGHTFSQVQSANAGLMIGNTTYQRRIYFRKAASHISAAVNVTITGDATANNFYYWGIECWQFNNYVQLINAGRGDHTLDALKPYFETDVYSRKPNLVVLEIPMANMLNTDSSFAYSLNSLQDCLFGDRAGNTNTWNFKSKSNNWVDWQLVCYLPHFRQGYYNSDGSYKTTAAGHTYRQVYDAVKSFLISKDIYVIDMEEVFQKEVAKNPDMGKNMYTAFTGSAITSIASFTNDTVHPNDSGVKIWREHSIF